MIQEIEKSLGKKAIIERLPLQPGDVERTFADINKAKKELGYNPDTEISAGLEKFAQWFNSKN